MATQSVHDVVNQTQSVGDLTPSDAVEITQSNHIIGGESEGLNGDQHHRVETPGADSESHRDEFSSKPESMNGETAVAFTDPNEQRPDSRLGREDGMLEDVTIRSDTDGSRAGSVTEEGKASETSKPVRKSSIKPVSFAKYSVIKTAPTGTVAKPISDKAPTPTNATSALLQAGRPRLVAKTTSTLQQKVKPYKSSAPDPMQVWNKNRVTPTPSTKHLTDEELKLQYGIHMTSRIQADGEGKEAKWADIDDDEDDWAPETIEWTDGTKSTLNPADVLQQATPEVQSEPETTDQPKPLQPSKILTSQFSSSVGPNATVLRLGGNIGKSPTAQTTVPQQKGPTEKPPSSSSQTAPAPPPAKSPWAALPPVEKVSPVSINPHIAMPPQRYPSGQGYFPNQAADVSPAKEISADDFNRTWRNAAPDQPRELFMPNSGRYEAVPEGRRRMSKHEGNFRAPAVLQRPNNDPHAPAEPSAAFQTHRSSTDTARRRASSTISGGSGQFARRMSLGKSSDGNQVPLEVIQARRDSSVFRPESRDGPPSQLQTPTYQARGPSPSYGFPPSQPSVPGQAQEDIEAERARQKVLMKEKIDLARKRKVQEEERLEAERKERIKLKLASLGPAPEKQFKKVDEPEPESANVPLPVQSPPKPPVPQASGAPLQYGMMKVHPMTTVKKIAPQGLQDSSTKMSPSMVNGVQQDGLSLDRSPRVTEPTRSGWGDVRTDQRHGSAQTASLWGPLNNSNKALGNGTFDQGLAGYAPHDLSSRQSSTPQGWTNGRTPVNDRSPQPQFIPPAEPTLAANSEIDSLLPTSRPAPIGPPQSRGGQNWQPSPTLSNANHGVAAWNNFHQAASHQERAEAERIQRELAAKREEELRTGVRVGPQYTFNETWKQVQLGDQAGQRAVTSIAQSSISAIPGFPPPPGFGAIGSVPDMAKMNGLPVKNSRFFPPNTETRRSVTYNHSDHQRSPSPPPAEEYASQHPAFDGDSGRPVVHFPREKPIVKLPSPTVPVETPVAVTSGQPLTWAARFSQTPPMRAVSQPLVQNPSWKEKIDGLLGREKGQPVEITPSTRDLLDVLELPSASVSLPPKKNDLMKDAGLVTSKDVEDEEDLFEDRQTGDLPIVKPPMGLSPSPHATGRAPFLQPPLFVESYSVPAFVLYNLYLPLHGKQQDDDQNMITFKFPTMMEPIKRIRPTKAASISGSTRGSKSRTSLGRHPKSRGGKARQSSEAHSSPRTPTQKSRQISGQIASTGAQTPPKGNSSSPALQPNGNTRTSRTLHRGSFRGKGKHQEGRAQPQAQIAH